MHARTCPTCGARLQLLVEAEPNIVRRGVDACKRGAGRGVLVALLEELGAETEDEAAELEAARAHYVGVVPVTRVTRAETARENPKDRLESAPPRSTRRAKAWPSACRWWGARGKKIGCWPG